MKNRRLSMLLALCLLCPAAASAEPAALTARELFEWRDAVWAYAAAQPSAGGPTATHDKNGAQIWLYAYAFGVIEKKRPAPGACEGVGVAEQVTGVELLGGGITCPRGIAVGDSLESVLSAYPNENPQLTGSAEFAALYALSVAEDGATGWGWLLRRGRTVRGVQYAAGIPAGGAGGFRLEPTLMYVIENGNVSAIRASGFTDLLSEKESAANASAVLALAGISAFVPPPSGEAAMPDLFEAFDLDFSGMSFAEGTPESFIETLGAPLEDSVSGGVRTLAFRGALAEFTQAGGAWRPWALLVADSALPGPRGILIGDSAMSVTALFGGQVDIDTLIYQCEDERGELFLLTLTFHDDMLTEYLLNRRESAA